MIKAPVYNQQGVKKGMVTIPEELCILPLNKELLHQVLVAHRANRRCGTTHTKNRSEVRGGGRKPYPQKGTGRARHGSIRSPLWVGGGVTFGPRNNKSYTQKINKKVQTRAFFTALSQQAQDNNIVFVDNVSFDKPTTKKAGVLIDKIRTTHKAVNGSLMIIFPEKNENAQKSFANLHKVTMTATENLSTTATLSAKLLLFINPEATFAKLQKRRI